MMHLSMILDPDACIYDAFIYVPRSLTMMHVCMMHISMILDLDPEACVYDAANFVPDQRTNEQGDSRSLIYDFLYIKKVTFPISGNFKPRG